MGDIYYATAGWHSEVLEFWPPPEPPYGTPMTPPELALCHDPDEEYFETTGDWTLLITHLFRFHGIPISGYDKRFRWKGTYWSTASPGVGLAIYNWVSHSWEVMVYGGPGSFWLSFGVRYYDWFRYLDGSGNAWVAGQLYLYPPYRGILSTDSIDGGLYGTIMENLSLASNLFGQAAIVTSQPDNNPSIELRIQSPGDFYPLDWGAAPIYPIAGGHLSRAEVEFHTDAAIQIRYVDAAGAAHRAVNFCDGEGAWIVDP